MNITMNQDGSVTLTSAQWSLIQDELGRLKKMDDYRKEYNKREDVVEKRKAYMKQRNEKIKVLLKKDRGE